MEKYLTQNFLNGKTIEEAKEIVADKMASMKVNGHSTR